MAPSIVLRAATLIMLAMWAGPASAVHYAGATSALPIFVTAYHYYSSRTSIGPYSADASLAGIDNFIRKQVLGACSDAPMTLAQERAAGPKYTLALALSSYSFVNSGSRTVRLSAAQVYAIYAGRITQWAQIPGSGLRGTIVPVARSVAAGTTAVVTRWIQESHVAIPARQVGMGVWRAGSRRTVYLPSSQAVANYVRRNRLALGYVQTAVGTAAGNHPVAAFNIRTRRYVAPSAGSPVRALPPYAKFPRASVSWAGLPNALLNSPAAGYPIVSIVHFFVRQHNGRSVGIIKPYLRFLMSNEAQGLFARAGFTPIPGWLKGNNLFAIGQIRI